MEATCPAGIRHENIRPKEHCSLETQGVYLMSALFQQALSTFVRIAIQRNSLKNPPQSLQVPLGSFTHERHATRASGRAGESWPSTRQPVRPVDPQPELATGARTARSTDLARAVRLGECALSISRKTRQFLFRTGASSITAEDRKFPAIFD